MCNHILLHVFSCSQRRLYELNAWTSHAAKSTVCLEIECIRQNNYQSSTGKSSGCTETKLSVSLLIS